MSNLRTLESRRNLLPWVQDPFTASMRELLRWDPFRELSNPTEGLDFMPSFEVKETPNTYVFKADLPGIKEEDLNVELTGNRLTIGGKRESEKKEDNESYHLYERSFGSFSRSFTLPEEVNSNKVDANLQHGVLTVTVLKSPEAKPQKIHVKG